MMEGWYKPDLNMCDIKGTQCLTNHVSIMYHTTYGIDTKQKESLFGEACIRFSNNLNSGAE